LHESNIVHEKYTQSLSQIEHFLKFEPYHLKRHVTGKIMPCTATWMAQLERRGMQHQSLSGVAAIEAIPDNGGTDTLQMHAQLM